MRNIKLTIAYDGTSFGGWQKQNNAPTIQGEIEKRLQVLTNTNPVTLHGAGRTDAGVHALAMVANFHTLSSITLPQLSRALNSMLPMTIRILAAEAVSQDFHARFSAHCKTYIYKIETGAIQSPMHRLYSVHVPSSLSMEKMKNCLHLLTGSHDFASFEASGSRDKSITTGRGSIRTLHEALVSETGAEALEFTFTGDGFLRHMVRNIMGTVLDVGKGRTSLADFKRILAAKDRSAAGATAPAHGLFLQSIRY
ncbi:MAG: tRNA pseudouridine(38-40) synthase TruA [Proteobacteria bacterium]|nr:tRNA pseudouridine(38-40) synthase TruA [Pseudomonadota bacterium]MBU1057030.1 tRNA pseudouridine(38-40) synthase TruA [Pseudomonadota bacterium]